jgi:hypothetical protein
MLRTSRAEQTFNTQHSTPTSLRLASTQQATASSSAFIRFRRDEKEDYDMTPPVQHPRDPLHGITLENIINQLVQRHGWGEMGRRIPIRCFQFNPTVKSSLTFLRKTPWARQRVEDWFIGELPGK